MDDARRPDVVPRGRGARRSGCPEARAAAGRWWAVEAGRLAHVGSVQVRTDGDAVVVDVVVAGDPGLWGAGERHPDALAFLLDVVRRTRP